MSSKFLSLSISSLLLASSLAANAAIIVPASGNISVLASGYAGNSSVPDLSFGANYGLYSNAAYAPTPADPGAPSGSGSALASADVQAHAIHLVTGVGGLSFGGGYGEASTTVNFSLTDTDFWTFKFFGPADTAAGTVTLSGASGVIVSMSSTCVENWHVAHTGFACHAQGATMQLGAGLYTLAFDYELTGSRAGVGGGTAMVDLLTPVPVPAALPLFGAALAGLGMMRRRRSA